MKNTGLPIMMGALTPSEVYQSYSNGSDVVKLFHGSLGGVAYMKALKGLFPDIPIMATGGVNLDNIPDWFAAGAFTVGVSTALFPKSLGKTGTVCPDLRACQRILLSI